MADLKDTLIDKKIPEEAVNKIIAYISNAKREETKKDPAKRPVSNNSADQLYSLIIKFWNMGLPVDGVNVVITGINMGMVTYHGYKNKVLATYPETQFDIQLVREGDEFRVSKESGSILYSHTIADPFATTPADIVGAYVVFKNKRGEFIETLNKADYENMKKASKQSYLWGQWESEFWLKSVIKRACKRHFFDVVAEIDKVDNDSYGLAIDEPPAEAPDKTEQINAAIDSLNTAKDLDQLRKIFMGLSPALTANRKVINAKDAKKEELMALPPTKGPLAKQGEVGNLEGVTIVPDEEAPTDENN